MDADCENLLRSETGKVGNWDVNSVLAPSNSQHRKCRGVSESSHILCHEFTKKKPYFSYF